MAQDIRVSQWVTLLIGEGPNTIEITPDPAGVTTTAPAVTLALTLLPAPAAVAVSPLVVVAGEPGATEPAFVTCVVPPVTVTFTDPPPQPPVSCVHETQPDYLAQLQDLLPRGFAWNREPDSVLTALLTAFSVELSCIDARARALLRESDPRTTLELLPDWEAALGLPDPCTGPLTGLQERRGAIVQRLTSRGGASPQYFEDSLAERGFPDARVIEFLPFVVGRSRVGDRMTSPQRAFRVGSSVVGDSLTNNENWLYTWGIEAPELSFHYFRVGESAVGEALRTWGNSPLECLVDELAPAHTFVLFFYFVSLQPEPAGVTLGVPAVSVS